LLQKPSFTLTAQDKPDQLFVSAPACGGTTALGELILPPLNWIEAPTAHVSLFLCAQRSFPQFVELSAMPPRLLNLRSSSMNTLLKASGIATAAAFAAFAAFAPGAVAQEISKSLCQAVGANGAPEPLGDREGHGISVITGKLPE
jgi:hypothetical protein